MVRIKIAAIFQTRRHILQEDVPRGLQQGPARGGGTHFPASDLYLIRAFSTLTFTLTHTHVDFVCFYTLFFKFNP